MLQKFDWRGLPYVLPLIFLIAISIPGVIFVGGIFHEWLHSQDFETESVCIDYTNNSFMYITSAYIYLGNETNNHTNFDERSLSVSRHFEVYALEGIVIGILFTLILLSSLLLTRFIVTKHVI